MRQRALVKKGEIFPRSGYGERRDLGEKRRERKGMKVVGTKESKGRKKECRKVERRRRNQAQEGGRIEIGEVFSVFGLNMVIRRSNYRMHLETQAVRMAVVPLSLPSRRCASHSGVTDYDSGTFVVVKKDKKKRKKKKVKKPEPVVEVEDDDEA